MTHDMTEAARHADDISRTIVKSEPGINRTAIRDALASFFSWRGHVGGTAPTKGDVTAYLDERIDQLGQKAACTDFAFLQIAAARIWAPGETSHFGVVLREARVAPKPLRLTEWTSAERSISHLPGEWRETMTEHLSLSRGESKATRRSAERWSASHFMAVSAALSRWSVFCDVRGMSALPTGTGFEMFARALHERDKEPVSAASAADYLARIYTGFATVILPGFASTSCEFVVRDWRERGDLEGSPTKTANQLVSATAIYGLGFDLMDRARERKTRGMRAALDFRNGILLATAVALPQRARALSVMDFDRTLFLLDRSSIRFHIPGAFIKQPEGRKEGRPYDMVIRNAALSRALREYAAEYRPLFDDGQMLFPSFHAPMQSISEKRLGRLAGDLTERAFGVRVSIHRFRDNVATEISETMPSGAYIASGVLGHRDAATTERHYDHSEGFRVATEFGDYVDGMRSSPVELAI